MSYSAGPASGMYFNCLHDYARAAQYSSSVIQSPTARYQLAPNMMTVSDLEMNNRNFPVASRQSAVYAYESPSVVETCDVDCDLAAVPLANPVNASSSNPIPSVRQDNLFDLPAGLKRQELVQNGLLPQLETMQLMRSENKRSKAKIELSPREDARKRVRREKNKMAAAKCRIKRREFSRSLKADHEDTEKLNTELKGEIKELTAHVERLQGLLESHDCVLSSEQVEEVKRRIKMMAQDGMGEDATYQVAVRESGESDDETVLNSGNSSPFLRLDMSTID